MDDLQRKVAVLADTAQTVLVQVTGDLNGTSGDTRKQLANLADRLLYLSYAFVDPLFWLDALKDQIAAGAFRWVFGSLMFLVPAIYLTARLMTNGRLIDEKTGLERARALAQ
jgi:hypothetical protein